MKQNTPRAREILDAVVRLNIETGRPVSSGLVERLLRKAYSSATIRTVMKQLEDDGYLLQPHTSAGRLPTDLGYRHYVDRLLRAWPLQVPEAPRGVRQIVAADIQRSAGSHEMIKVLASLLSDLTANISIILGPSWATVRAERVDLYPKGDRRVLMVLVLENALVRTSMVNVKDDIPDEVLEDAGRILSERICGRTVSEIRTAVLPSLDAAASRASRCASDLARLGQHLFSEIEAGDIQLEGVRRVLDEPEFSQPEPLKALLRFIESPRTVRDALERLDQESDDDLSVWIGAENPVGELRSFSLLTSPFDLDGRRGILAVLGLRRMPYRRAFTGLDFLRRALRTTV